MLFSEINFPAYKMTTTIPICDSSPPRASLTKDDSPSAFIFLSTESGSLFPTW